MLKRELHKRSYADAGEGERYEVFNFAKSGAKISFVQGTFKDQLRNYKRSNAKTIALVAIGGNNTKAENEPDNFVSTPEEYEAELTTLLQDIQRSVDQVVFIGSGYVDEAKTNPKHNPLTGGKSYFTNERRAIFEEKLKEICEKLHIPLVSLDVSETEWKSNYLYVDGLHPNSEGHAFIFGKVLAVVEPFLN